MSLCKILSITLLLFIQVKADACDKDACVAKAKQYTKTPIRVKSAEDKVRAIEFLDLHKDCSCGVLEGAYAVGYRYMAEDAARKVQRFDGTEYDMNWLQEENAKAKSQDRAASAAQMKQKEADAESMLTEISQKKDWSEFTWMYGGPAYEQSSNPCVPITDIAKFIANWGCDVDEYQSKKGIVFFKCQKQHDGSAFGLTAFYKDETTCRTCFPRKTYSATNRMTDKAPRCYENLRKNLTKK